jgi:hypothetical protein
MLGILSVRKTGAQCRTVTWAHTACPLLNTPLEEIAASQFLPHPEAPLSLHDEVHLGT